MGLFSSNKNGKNGTKINTKSSMQNKKSKKTTPFDVPKTVQDSIPYLGVYENGIMHIKVFVSRFKPIVFTIV